MTVFWVQVRTVESGVHVSGEVQVGEMEPGLTDEDEGGIFFFNDNFEVELVPGKAKDIPGNNFD